MRLWLLFVLLPSVSLAQNQTPPSFSRCDPLIAQKPQSEETARCIDETGEALKQPEQTADRLREILRRHPGSPWPTLFLAYLDREHSDALFRSAARGFAARRDAKGEVLARANIHRSLFAAGKIEDAEAEAERAVRVAEASGQPEVIARANTLKARHLWATGKDLEQAYVLLRRAESVLFPSGTYYMKRDCLSGLANLSLELGRYREGFDAFRRLTNLATAERDQFGEASARYGMARAVLDETAELPTDKGRQEAMQLAQAALDSALAAKNRGIESKSHFLLGVLSHGDEARRHFDACLAAADNARDQSYCLNGLARILAHTNPREAQRAIDRSIEIARQAQDYWPMAFAWRERMRVSWAAGEGERAVEDSRSALDAIEALRDLQAETSGQAQMFSTWAEDYNWLAGRLIASSLKGKGGRENLERAFLVSERMRARTLIDTLEAAHAVPAAAVPIRQERAKLLERISSVQRRLFDPDLPAGQRAPLLRELEGLEVQEADLRNRLARTAPVLDASRRPDFATLSRVRGALGLDEALLSFQVAPWEDERGDFAGGSWVTVVTRGGTRVYRLPGRGELRPAVRMFNGTFEPRKGAESLPAVGLYRRLLQQPLQDLPPGIRRLILVPDDALHQLPFGALHSSPQSPPLAVQYELTQVPSATLWLSWEGRRPEAAPIPALALADPPLPGGRQGIQPAAARERAAVFASGVRLGPLPYAREESRSVVRDLGGGSIRRLGEEASEVYIKGTPLRQFGILHFATHAVTDESNPDRSGVLLAPGAANQDGLLQIREIVDLELDGRVVVLSACSSNTGAVLRGEGVMSLARAFFQSGAHTVVASLWRLRDDEAADLFDRFYQHVGEGRSVAASLQAAQRELIAEGAPAAAWAGIVVLGDGDLVPLPGGRRETGPPAWLCALGGLGLLVLGLAVVRLAKLR